MIKWRHKRGLRRVWKAYGNYVREASLRFGVPREIILAVIWRESRGKAGSIRREPKLGDASYGLMQILCSTARSLGFKGECWKLFDPRVNVHFGTAYLAWLKNHGLPTWPLAVAGYNAGPGRVLRLCRRFGFSAKAIFPRLPSITRKYLTELFGKSLEGGGTVDLAREVLRDEF